MNKDEYQKAKRLLKSQTKAVTVKILLVLLCITLVSFGEYICNSFVEEGTARLLIFTVFFLIRLCFSVPLVLGVFRSILYLPKKAECFVLCYFSDLKSFFGTVFSAAFTCVTVVAELMIAVLFYGVLTTTFNATSGAIVAAAMLAALMLFCTARMVMISTVSALNSSTRNFLSVYLKKFGGYSLPRYTKKQNGCR